MRLNEPSATQVALGDKSIPTGFLEARYHYLAMKDRFHELGWKFNDEDFWEWYDGYHYGSKVVCESIRCP